MKCTDCRYHLAQDVGYSNYTVEGTDVYCLLKKNPGLPSDRWYEEDPALNYANQCDSFKEGDGVGFDVDGEVTAEDYKSDPEIYELLKKWEGA